MAYYKWKPSATQKREYRQKMLDIADAKSKRPEGYTLDATGDCCIGDEVAFFQAGKSGDRMYGVISAESYGADRQQHTFTILLEDGERTLIKGRNLYDNGVYRKPWPNEAERKAVLDEKHARGDKARQERENRKAQM